MGNLIETYSYKKPVYVSYRKRIKKLKKDPDDFESSQPSLFDFTTYTERGTDYRKRFDSLTRTRQNIRRIINSNTDFTKFVTLTFADEGVKLDVAHKCFKTFIQRLTYNYKNIKYLSVVEFQKDVDFHGKVKKKGGSVHYHLLVNKYIPSKKLETIWGNGFVQINKIKGINNIGSYVSKYMRKDITDPRLFGRKVYFCSKNVLRPEIITDVNICNSIEKMYNLDKRESLKQFSYENDFVGEVDYSLYKI